MKAVVLLACLLLLQSGTASSKAKLPEPGTVKTFLSPSGTYRMDVKILGNPDRDPSACTFKRGDSVLWTKELPTTPKKVEIADDGSGFAFLNYYNYDEGWVRGVSFYAGDGRLLKTIDFVGKGERTPREWVRNCALSKSRAFVALSVRTKSSLICYSLPGVRELWKRSVGRGKVYEMLTDDASTVVLLSLYDTLDFKFIRFLLLDREGRTLWSPEARKGCNLEAHGWPRIINLSRDGSSFQVFDPEGEKWTEFVKQGKSFTRK